MHETASLEWRRHELIRKEVFGGREKVENPRDIGGNQKQESEDVAKIRGRSSSGGHFH